MITFNHEEFIQQAIDSVIKQQADFNIELVIGDDASTDKTPEIIANLKSSENLKIIPIIRPKNIGMMRNFVNTLESCTGRYIALLDGDDYWIDPKKLQLQVDFLEKNPDYSICYHPVKVKHPNAVLEVDEPNDKRDVTDIYDLANGNFMHTCSVVFRSHLFDNFPSSFLNSTVGDYFLHMLNAQYGKIKKMPQYMGVYRIHQDGVWSMKPDMDLKILTYLESMIGCFENDINEILKKRHKEIAFKSFCKRINEEGYRNRLLRCITFGEEVMQLKLKEMLELSNTKSNSPLNIFKKFVLKFKAFK